MVQAAVGTALAGAGTAVRGFKDQSRREVSRPSMPESATATIALAKDRKQAKLALDNAREERLMYLLTQPEVIGWLVTIGGIAASQTIPFSSNKGVNEMIQGTATTASVLMGLGHAGVGDLTTAVVAGLAGVASVLSGISISDVISPNIDIGTLPGLTEDETKEVVRNSIWKSMPFGIGYLF